MKLKEFNFNSLKDEGCNHICIMEECSTVGKISKRYEKLTIGETLEALPISWADREIKDTRWFFETFVIELVGNTD